MKPAIIAAALTLLAPIAATAQVESLDGSGAPPADAPDAQVEVAPQEPAASEPVEPSEPSAADTAPSESSTPAEAVAPDAAAAPEPAEEPNVTVSPWALPEAAEPAAPTSPEAPAPTASLWDATAPTGGTVSRGWDPRERANRNEIGIEFGRHSLPIGKDDRDLFDGLRHLSGATVGLAGRAWFGTGGSIAYVNHNWDDGVLELDIHGFDVAVRHNWDPVSFVTIYGGGGAGARWADIAVDDLGLQVYDKAVTWTAEGYAGVSVRYASQHGYFGFFTDHGYLAHGTLDFDEARASDSDRETQPLPVDLGELVLGGYRWRAGLIAGAAF